MTEIVLDARQSAAARDCGIAQVKAKEETWHSRVLKVFIAWVMLKREAEKFSMEDFRAWYAQNELVDPLSANAWGALGKTVQAKKLGLLIQDGVEHAKSKTARARLIRTYRRNMGFDASVIALD